MCTYLLSVTEKAENRQFTTISHLNTTEFWTFNHAMIICYTRIFSVGEYNFERPVDSFAKKHEKYGDVLREELLPGVVLYHLFDPADFEKLFRGIGKYPERLSLQSLAKYRKENNKANGLTEL